MMGGMDDLVTFLRARLDEDEQAARATLWDGSGNVASWQLPASVTVEVGDDEFYVNDRTVANHIARHDPARVLADVNAKRRMLEDHKPARLAYLPGREPGCVTCTTAQQWDARAGEAHCSTLCLLALPYADHPDYQPKWRP